MKTHPIVIFHTDTVSTHRTWRLLTGETARDWKRFEYRRWGMAIDLTRAYCVQRMCYIIIRYTRSRAGCVAAALLPWNQDGCRMDRSMYEVSASYYYHYHRRLRHHYHQISRYYYCYNVCVVRNKLLRSCRQQTAISLRDIIYLPPKLTKSSLPDRVIIVNRIRRFLDFRRVLSTFRISNTLNDSDRAYTYWS
jgi:hypothetical protein